MIRVLPVAEDPPELASRLEPDNSRATAIIKVVKKAAANTVIFAIHDQWQICANQRNAGLTCSKISDNQ